MNQGGVKHATAETTRLDNKRERRRGAAGRAAALRRAPSDSDCSGETASLSADSGDRVVRPQPQPPRSAKSRSRRRGSEWEVLEGLKDGQRFDKRPDVFNGYLHKKRKWPLKGWHKRFFVVDGGILVYARSPTDVARGRLHGSVDVGLSVISAKARRRRIDIDADEFIYHLRAKTPEVFRTWLNVLKAHRLYRQHLLTFGARESVPKIHAPLDDLPPTDTSSRASKTSTEMSSHSEDYGKSYSNESQNITKMISVEQNRQIEYNADVSKHNNKNQANIKQNCLENCVKKNLKTKMYNKSLCSMNCAKRLMMEIENIGSIDTSCGSTETEKQIHTTELDYSSLKSTDPGPDSVPICEVSLDSGNASLKTIKRFANYKISSISQTNVSYKANITAEDNMSIFRNRSKPTNAYYLFTRNKHSAEITDSPMKRSRKSTNLIKYKNIIDEPPLKRPLSRCMLLKKYKLKASKQVDTDKGHSRAVACDPVLKENNEIQVNINEKSQTVLQHVATSSEYDRITEKLMVTIFEGPGTTDKGDEVKYYINQVVRDLYDDRLNQEINPVKALFKSLLEYWLKHTSFNQFKEAMTMAKSIEKPSNKYFTKDKNISSNVVTKVCKETQFHGLSDLINELNNKKNTTRHTYRNKTENKSPLQYHNPRHDTESFEKEKRIQKLEKLLKNTVYICETGISQSREKDIRITKTLIDNIGKLSYKSEEKSDGNANETSNSSTELPKIQETINKLINETDIPPDVAKEFFNAYLDMLRNDSSQSGTNTSSQSSEQVDDVKRPVCDVRTETIVKKVSKSVTTLKPTDLKETKPEKNDKCIDPGQMYLKDVLDKITTIFSKSKKTDDKNWYKPAKEDSKHENKIDVKDELARLIKDNKEIICEKIDENSLLIDLSKYNLENITMSDDPASKGTTSINIQLKEKADTPRSKRAHLSLRFSNESKPQIKTNNWLPCTNLSNTSDDLFNRFTMDIQKHALDCGRKEIIDLKPYLSTSDGTSKAFRFINDSKDSLNISFSHNIFQEKESYENDMKSCFIMSTLKKNAVTKFQLKKKVKDGIALDSNTHIPVTTDDHNEELKVFEEPTPRIIDEKFILLLLENLTLLSRGVPGLHKEINNLFVKLKKKYEKVVKNSPNIQGLSLLGKIYNDGPTVKDNGTQFEDINKTCTKTYLIETQNTGINTQMSTENKVVISKSINALHLAKEVTHDFIQTEEIIKANKSSTKEDVLVPNTAQTHLIGTNNAIQTAECATSNQNSAKRTQECAMSTMLKYVNKDDRSANKMTNVARPLRNETEICKKNRVIPKSPEELIREMSFLVPSAKISRQSQTNRMMGIRKDKKVYQMLLCQHFVPTRRSSLTESNINVSWSDELKTVYRCSSIPSYCSGLVSPTSPPIRGPQFVSGTPGGRLASWIIESGGPLENASRELGQAQLSIQQLQRLLDALEMQQQVHHDTDVSVEGASPNVKKDRRKFGLRKKKSNNKCASVELAPPHMDPSTSHMALSALTAPPSPGGGASSVPNSAASLPIACAAARPQSLPGAEALGPNAGPASISSLTPDHQLREDFTVLAKDLLASLKSIVATLVCERGRLRAAMEAADSTGTPGGSVMAALRTNLTSALQQNSELRSRLSRIHLASDIAEISSIGPSSDPQLNRQFQQSLSYSSSCVSASEFFDAEEHEDDDLKPEEVIAANEAGVIELDGDSSSEAGSLSSEEGSASSDNSDVLSAEQETLRLNANGTEGRVTGGWSRRTRLPAPRPTPGGPSLWNLLYKNIGKDLSQISMPVTINEPLNMLQRLCEELEYSALLDAAAACGSAVERMSLVAAFAVSAYAASAHRAASKPFNPLLAETYECVRDDRDFRFLAEQVSHHPPISACHAESSRWCFWQEARIKTKFWGKSMEFQPTGRVHVKLTTTGDHYSWNKVTTCVHNLFGGQRWVDQYGDMHIVCHGTDITCKLNFIKASSWSSSRHEVRGSVCEGAGGARVRLAGRWSEALYAGDPPAARCLWRPGAMPPEHEAYYGFTRFAMELNELEPGMRDALPHTDTRLRPDQRALEEGDVESAEQLKHELEQAQRDRRRDSPPHTPAWFRKSVESGEETWVFTGEYWKAREAGFPDLLAPRIW